MATEVAATLDGRFELRWDSPRPVRLIVHDALDHTTVEAFRIISDRAVGSRAVVINLDACSDVDAAGVGGLLRSVRRIHEAGGRVVITTAARSPLTLRLRHAGVSRLAPVIPHGDTSAAA